MLKSSRRRAAHLQEESGHRKSPSFLVRLVRDRVHVPTSPSLLLRRRRRRLSIGVSARTLDRKPGLVNIEGGGGVGVLLKLHRNSFFVRCICVTSGHTHTFKSPPVESASDRGPPPGPVRRAPLCFSATDGTLLIGVVGLPTQ